MIVTLPWPAKELFPNWKRAHHWRSYRPAEAQARKDGAIATLEAAGADISAFRGELEGEGLIALAVRFYPPDRRYRDDDGMVGAIKNFRDGIADALKVDDRRFRCHYFFEDPAKPGRVEVELSAGLSAVGDRPLPYQDSSAAVDGLPPSERMAA
jgi:crossover junction endodeoxyribonuclease RusA